MSILVRPPSGGPPSWAHAPVPVIVGFAPPDTVRFSDLTDARVAEAWLDAIARRDTVDRRRAALSLLHACLRAVEILLTAPLVLDGVTLDLRAHELGVRLRDAEPDALWVATVRTANPTDPARHLGVAATALLVPVIAALQAAERLPSRGIDEVMLEGLAAGYRRCARIAGHEPDPGFVARLTAGAGRSERRMARELPVVVDGGPPVTFHVPPTCCVLATTAVDGSCPTCPQWPDDAARRNAVRAWVGPMDAAEFRATTGRDRIEPSAAGNGR